MIAIVLTTFLRPQLARETIQSILDNWVPDYGVLIVVDQSGTLCLDDPRVQEIGVPFDCGLSAARNYGVRCAALYHGCEHTLITADSIQFTAPYDFSDVYTNMRQYDLDLVGFDLAGRVPWEGKLTMDPTYGYPFKVHKRPYDGSSWLLNIDICRNFFLARTASLLAVKWDEDLKLREHEDWFWRYKLTGHHIGWTSTIQAQYVDCKPDEYVRYRNRMYREYDLMVRRKYSESTATNVG